MCIGGSSTASSPAAAPPRLPLPFTSASTSCLRTRPPRPVPGTCERSTSCSAAIRCTTGEYCRWGPPGRAAGSSAPDAAPAWPRPGTGELTPPPADPASRPGAGELTPPPADPASRPGAGELTPPPADPASRPGAGEPTRALDLDPASPSDTSGCDRPLPGSPAGPSRSAATPVAIRANTTPTSTAPPHPPRISVTTPLTGAGTSVSILSVEISQIVWSASIRSPACTRQPTTVPSTTDTPICGMVTSVSAPAPAPASAPPPEPAPAPTPSVREELTARLLDTFDAGKHHLFQGR